MDPNAALQSILCGHEVVEHAEALLTWLRKNGFRPELLLPADCEKRFADLAQDYAGGCHRRPVRADMRGIWFRDGHDSGDWRRAFTWEEILHPHRGYDDEDLDAEARCSHV